MRSEAQESDRHLGRGQKFRQAFCMTSKREYHIHVTKGLHSRVLLALICLDSIQSIFAWHCVGTCALMHAFLKSSTVAKTHALDHNTMWHVGARSAACNADSNRWRTQCPSHSNNRATLTDSRDSDGRLPQVAYEDDHVLVINKPHGIGFHVEQDGSPGVMILLRKMQACGELEYTGRLFPVHRLDKVTSGCLVLAKTREVASEVMTALSERRVAKYYIAISDKKPSKKMGTVSGDMTRGRRSTWRLTRTQENPAVTSFIQKAFSVPPAAGESTKRDLRAFLLRPKTGKSHQIRVALRSLSAPILGDELYYTGEGAAGARSKDEDRTYLHACAIRLIVQGELIQIVCPPWEGGGELFESDEFKACFEALLPSHLSEDRGVWFQENSLIRSDPFQLAGGALET